MAGLDASITNVMFAPSLPGNHAFAQGSASPTGSPDNLSTTSQNADARTPRHNVTAKDLMRLNKTAATAASGTSGTGAATADGVEGSSERVGGTVPGMEGDVNLEMDEYNDIQANNTLKR